MEKEFEIRKKKDGSRYVYFQGGIIFSMTSTGNAHQSKKRVEVFIGPYYSQRNWYYVVELKDK